MDEIEKYFLIDALKREMPEYDFAFQKVILGNDEVRDEVCIKLDGEHYAPLFNPDRHRGKLFSDIAVEMRELLDLLAMKQYEIGEQILSDTFVKDNVRLQLINTQRNRNYLKDKVNFRVNSELSAIFYVSFDKEESARGIITERVFNDLALDMAELKQAALRNMEETMEMQYTAEIAENIEAGIENVMHNKDMSEIMQKLQEGKLDKMVVLSNHTREYGAATIFCEKFLQNCNQDLIVLPSSIHEMMILPVAKEISDLRELQKIVETINITTISETDRLSDNVYMYDHNSRQVSIACDRYGLVPLCDDTKMIFPDFFSKKR